MALAVLRSLRPQAGALANARDAIERGEQSAVSRRHGALGVAHAQGPRSWQPLHKAAVPDRCGDGHAVHFATCDADLVARLAQYVADGLAKGDVCVVIATAAHRAGVHAWLTAHSLEGQGSGRVVELDAELILGDLRATGTLDLALFDRFLAETILPMLPADGRFRAFGEIVGLLHRSGDLAGALEIEKRWEIVQRRLGFPLLCAYVDVDPGDSVSRICGTHTHLAS